MYKLPRRAEAGFPLHDLPGINTVLSTLTPRYTTPEKKNENAVITGHFAVRLRKTQTK